MDGQRKSPWGGDVWAEIWMTRSLVVKIFMVGKRKDDQVTWGVYVCREKRCKWAEDMRVGNKAQLSLYLHSPPKKIKREEDRLGRDRAVTKENQWKELVTKNLWRLKCKWLEIKTRVKQVCKMMGISIDQHGLWLQTRMLVMRTCVLCDCGQVLYGRLSLLLHEMGRTVSMW